MPQHRAGAPRNQRPRHRDRELIRHQLGQCGRERGVDRLRVNRARRPWPGRCGRSARQQSNPARRTAGPGQLHGRHPQRAGSVGTPVALEVALDVAPGGCGRGCVRCCVASKPASTSPQINPTISPGTPVDIPSAAALPARMRERVGAGLGRRGVLRGSGAMWVVVARRPVGRRAGSVGAACPA